MDLTTIEARRVLVGKYANQNGLAVPLVCAVCEQESSWNPWAIRFEPAFEARYIRPALPAAPTTLEITRAMSFGLMQVMGEVAIEFGWRGRFLTELLDPDTGVDFGCRKLGACMRAMSGNLELGLLRYNGGGNSFYAKQVLDRMKTYE